MKLKSIILATAVAASALSASAADVASREHRAVWMTPFLSSNWPSAALTSDAMVENQQRIINNRMKSFKSQNINVVYFHVRSNCDANYRSSYEPWSSSTSGTRGVEPCGDPLQMILNAAHAYGIEVYAWVNPYRYSNNTSYGDHELNYENSHPDWLIRNSRQTVLNPGLEEVKQRIVDVVSEIVTKYDVDGIVYDDFFYPQGGMPGYNGVGNVSDGDDYQLYLDSKSSLSIHDWRRAQVNDMVHRVYTAIKAAKPYVVFGISPAGVSSPDNIESTYGLKPIAGDWQYDCIYSDPLAWLKAGDIDFISPQIYWPSRYDELSDWWAIAARKFNRHFYPSVDISDISSIKTPEFIREAQYSRQIQNRDASGFVVFQYAQFVNYSENIFGSRLSTGGNLAAGVFTTKALTPIRPWNNVRSPQYVADISRSASSLTWTEIPGMRYTVYAIPADMVASFAQQREFLDGVSYSNSYDIPADKADCTFAVAAYDRFGNEYPAMIENRSLAQAVAPVLTYPVNGDKAGYLFNFSWSSDDNHFIFELADDAAFSNIVSSFEVVGKSVPVTDLPPLVNGNTYYWRVRTVAPCKTEAISEIHSFIASEISIISPADGSTDVDYHSPQISWQKAIDGTSYRVVIATFDDLRGVVLDTSVEDVDHLSVPDNILNSGRKYYVQVTATNGSSSSSSAITSFTTADRTDYTAPVFLNPAANGQTIHSNQAIEIAPWEGMRSVTVQISTSSSFPSRSGTVSMSLDNYQTVTKNLGEVKISSKNLVSGTTYYVRTRGSYNVSSSSDLKYTDYSPVMTFVYSSEAGVADIQTSDDNIAYVDADNVLHFSPGAARIDVFSLTGASVMSTPAPADSRLSLDSLAPGLYIIRIAGHQPQIVKWVK